MRSRPLGLVTTYRCARCRRVHTLRGEPVEGCAVCRDGEPHFHIRCETCSPPGWWACVMWPEDDVMPKQPLDPDTEVVAAIEISSTMPPPTEEMTMNRRIEDRARELIEEIHADPHIGAGTTGALIACFEMIAELAGGMPPPERVPAPPEVRGGEVRSSEETTRAVSTIAQRARSFLENKKRNRNLPTQDIYLENPPPTAGEFALELLAEMAGGSPPPSAGCGVKECIEHPPEARGPSGMSPGERLRETVRALADHEPPPRAPFGDRPVEVSERACGCSECGKVVALVGDKLVTGICMWCIAEAAPRAAALFARDVLREAEDQPQVVIDGKPADVRDLKIEYASAGSSKDDLIKMEENVRIAYEERDAWRDTATCATGGVADALHDFIVIAKADRGSLEYVLNLLASKGTAVAMAARRVLNDATGNGD